MSEPLTHQKYLDRKYLDELDGLRALSVLMVVTVHMHDKPVIWHWLGGWQGVTIFFVLSGYLITMLSLKEEAKRGSVSLTAFYIRRSFRIFPLYYLVLALYCLLIFGGSLFNFWTEKREPLKQALPWYLLYMQEVPHFYGVQEYRDPPPDGTTFDADGLARSGDDWINQQGALFVRTDAGITPRTTHTNIPFYQSWSLGVEEKFYLVWPVLIFVWLKGQRNPRYWMALFLVVAFALTGQLPRFSQDPNDHSLAHLADCLYPYYSILFGCLLALLLHDASWYERFRFLGKPVWSWITLGVLLVLHFTRPQLSPEQKLLGYICDTAYVLAVGAFLICLLIGEGPIQRGLAWKPLVLIGRLSYGIYLIHILCLNAVQLLFKKVLPSQYGYKIPGTDNNITDDYFDKEPNHDRMEYLGTLLQESPGKVALSVLAVILSCIITVGVAWLLHQYIEKPLIEIGRKWSNRVMAKGAPTVAVKPA